MGKLRMALIAVAVVVGAFLFLVTITHSRESNYTVFHVNVPTETPALDSVTVNVEGDVFPMQKVGPHEYQATVDTRGYEWGRAIRYGYVRGGFQPFGEATFLGNVGNRTFVPGVKDNVVNDTVPSWKWLPNQAPDNSVPSSVNNYAVAHRDIWTGPDMVDFWNDNFPLQYNSTIAHFKSEGYTWVELDPPWDYQSVDPPVISDGNVTVPSWPEDKLIEEIRAFKAAGFKVYLGPQVCCTEVNFTGRSDAWWSAWYDQYQNFVQFHADLVRREHVDAMSISAPEDSLPGFRNAPSFAAERWNGILAAERSSGVQIGYNLGPIPPGNDPQPLWPPEAYAFMDKIDFIASGMWNNVSYKQFPTQGEIDAGFAPIFRDLDYAHNTTGKPIVFSQVAYFSRNGSAEEKGPEDFPTWGDPAVFAPRNDDRTQAMIYESLMRYVANRSYIQGMFPFGYWYVSSPLNLDSDIRDKPAEEIFSAWTKKIRGS